MTIPQAAENAVKISRIIVASTQQKKMRGGDQNLLAYSSWRRQAIGAKCRRNYQI